MPRNLKDRPLLRKCFRCNGLTANLGPAIYRGATIRLPPYCTRCLDDFSQRGTRQRRKIV